MPKTKTWRLLDPSVRLFIHLSTYKILICCSHTIIIIWIGYEKLNSIFIIVLLMEFSYTMWSAMLAIDRKYWVIFEFVKCCFTIYIVPIIFLKVDNTKNEFFYLKTTTICVLLYENLPITKNIAYILLNMVSCILLFQKKKKKVSCIFYLLCTYIQKSELFPMVVKCQLVLPQI